MGEGGQSEQIRGCREARCHEVAEHAATLAGQSLANEQHRHKVAECAAALAALVLAREQRCHEVAELTAMLLARALANEQHIATRRPNALRRWQNWRWLVSNIIDNSNGNSDGNGKDTRNGDYGTMVIIPYKNKLTDSAQKGQTLLYARHAAESKPHKIWQQVTLAWFGCNLANV
jgi:hypothetical protein